MNPLLPPVSQGQAMARRRRMMRQLAHWHQTAMRGLLQIDGDEVALLLVTQAALRVQSLLSQEPAKAAPSAPAARTAG